MVKPVATKNIRTTTGDFLHAAHGAMPIFITDQNRIPDPERVLSALPAGALVICRDYDHDDRTAYAQWLRSLTSARGQHLLVAGDAGLARRVRADGIHLPEHQLFDFPKLAGFSIVTAACHSRRALRRAEHVGVDIALVSPVFATSSHIGTSGMGVHRFARLVVGVGIAVAPLGGVNKHTVKCLRALRPIAVAAIDGFDT